MAPAQDDAAWVLRGVLAGSVVLMDVAALVGAVVALGVAARVTFSKRAVFRSQAQELATLRPVARTRIVLEVVPLPGTGAAPLPMVDATAMEAYFIAKYGGIGDVDTIYAGNQGIRLRFLLGNTPGPGDPP